MQYLLHQTLSEYKSVLLNWFTLAQLNILNVQTMLCANIAASAFQVDKGEILGWEAEIFQEQRLAQY